jgi:uncharacterized protein (TIGR03066 family)
MLLRATALLGLLLVLSPATADDKKDDPKTDEKLIVGKWKLVKTSQGDLPEGLEIVLEMQKGGKFKLTTARGDEKDVVAGTWKLDGKKLPLEFTEGSRKGNKQTDTIKELTEKKLTLLDQNELTEYWERVGEKKKDK